LVLLTSPGRVRGKGDRGCRVHPIKKGGTQKMPGTGEAGTPKGPYRQGWKKRGCAPG